ncbi:unnamed protein product [Linum trigynum]|uniref:Uncharacterized protein n=1 Tax=Linum trigynum TaxID=586398 RepID=A0AAV2FRZ5_9ROSI
MTIRKPSYRSAPAVRPSILVRGVKRDPRVRKPQRPESRERCSKWKCLAGDLAPINWSKRHKKNPRRGWRFQLPSSLELEEKCPSSSIALNPRERPCSDSLVNPEYKAQGNQRHSPAPITKLDASALKMWQKGIGGLGLRPSICVIISAGIPRLRRRSEIRDKNIILFPDNHPWFLGIQEIFSKFTHGYRLDLKLSNPTRTLPLQSVRLPPCDGSRGLDSLFKSTSPVAIHIQIATVVDWVRVASQRRASDGGQPGITSLRHPPAHSACKVLPRQAPFSVPISPTDICFHDIPGFGPYYP